MERLILQVPDMTCSHCEAAVKSEVGRVRGVGSVAVDLTTKTVEVDGNELDLAAITAAIDDAGFEVAGCSQVR